MPIHISMRKEKLLGLANTLGIIFYIAKLTALPWKGIVFDSPSQRKKKSFRYQGTKEEDVLLVVLGEVKNSGEDAENWGNLIPIL